MQGEEIGVELLPTGGDCRQGEVPGYELPAIDAHLMALSELHRHDLGHCVGEGGDVAYGNEMTGDAGLHGFCYAAGVGGYDWEACGGGFEDAHWQTFPEGGLDEGVGCGEQGLDVLMEAEEVDAVCDAEFGGERAEGGFFGAGACDLEMGIVGEDGEGAEEGWVVLYGGEAADGQPLE